MPLPTPKPEESKDDFVARCMIFQKEDGKLDLENEDDRKQALAMCYSQFESKKESTSTPIRTMKQILKEGK